MSKYLKIQLIQVKSTKYNRLNANEILGGINITSEMIFMN